ncbi:MAG TPA: hypothetical protein PKV72_07120, partial [Candidatus Peribacteria bacterium]|nr:hypothetical protein [Candidatus Peribacteria bacterium]
MSNRQLHFAKAPASQETTLMFDALDRWRIAERFGIDRVHDKTRMEIYEAVADGRRCDRFQDVVRDLASVAGAVAKDELMVVNWDEFTNDLPEG